MKPRKSGFSILFISIFVFFGSVSCSDSRGVGSVGPKPSPVIDSSQDNHFIRFHIKNLPDIPVEIYLLRGDAHSQCTDNNLILLRKVSVQASQNEIEIKIKKRFFARGMGTTGFLLKLWTAEKI